MGRRGSWRPAFLAALRRGGSIVGAARAAGVDKTTAYGARRRDAAFAADWDQALRAAQDGLAADASGAGEAPTLARDEIVRASVHGRPCVMRVGPGRWSSAKEAVFLRALAETANVKRAAEAAGVSTCAVYGRRAKWPGFAEAWAEALAQGYTDVELMLIENAKATLGQLSGGGQPAPACDGERLTAAMSVGDALSLIKLHRASVKGGKPQRYGWRRREPDIEEVRAEVLRKVAAMERAGRFST